MRCYKGDAVPAMRTVCVNGEVSHDKEGEYQLSLYVRKGDMYKLDNDILPAAYKKISEFWEKMTKFPLPEMPAIEMPPRYEVSGKLLDDQIRLVVIAPDKDSVEAMGDQVLAWLSQKLEIPVYDYRYAQERMQHGSGGRTL